MKSKIQMCFGGPAPSLPSPGTPKRGRHEGAIFQFHITRFSTTALNAEGTSCSHQHRPVCCYFWEAFCLDKCASNSRLHGNEYPSLYENNVVNVHSSQLIEANV